MKEIWKDVPNYEGLYEVSDKGRVRKTFTREILNQFNPKNGRDYLYVSLNKNKKNTNLLVHRLVAMAFIPNPENKPEVDHINRYSLDNKASNLRWVTREENMQNRQKRNKGKLVVDNDAFLPYLKPNNSPTLWLNPYAWE